jgi:hypothetical protein
MHTIFVFFIKQKEKGRCHIKSNAYMVEAIIKIKSVENRKAEDEVYCWYPISLSSRSM